MDKSLSIKMESNHGAPRAALFGDITEDSDFSQLLTAQGGTLSLDLAEVRRINSTGVREWIKFVNGLIRSGKQLVLERCSVAIVQQLNMISNFRGNGEVLSILAPYYCGSCDSNHLHLIDLTQGEPILAPSMPCPRCKADMEFDDMPESYLAFRQY